MFWFKANHAYKVVYSGMWYDYHWRDERINLSDKVFNSSQVITLYEVKGEKWLWNGEELNTKEYREKEEYIKHAHLYIVEIGKYILDVDDYVYLKILNEKEKDIK